MAAKRKYPWERWFAQARTIVVRGIDYECSQSAMVQAIRNNASTRGVSIRVRDVGHAIVIERGGETNGKVLHPDQTPVHSESGG